MDRYADLHARIDRLCERARAHADGELAREMEYLLSEGYARALMAEQRLVRLDERVVEVLLAPGDSRARDIRGLTEERRAAAHAVERLRSHLDAMRERYVALRAG